MQKTPVKSSSLVAAGYDINENVLEVQFRGGALYQYLAVPEIEYTNLMNSESKGKYLYQNIKGKYVHRKVK